MDTETRIEQAFQLFVEPFLLGRADRFEELAPQGPAGLLERFDRLGDFDLSAGELKTSPCFQRIDPKVRGLINDNDALRKKGRRLDFLLSGPRRLSMEGTPFEAEVNSSFSLEFEIASEPLADRAVEQRKLKALDLLPTELKKLPGSKIVVAVVLPQEKALLGVNTPLGIRALGLRFSLRFLLASFLQDRVRVHAVGPTLIEVTK